MSYPQGGLATEAVAAANNPNGDGGLGARFWVGDGDDVGTDAILIDFPTPEPEIWLRWYMRYEAGFQWAGGIPAYDKLFYMWTTGPLVLFPQPSGNGTWAITIIGGGPTYQATSPLTWQDTFGTVSDGFFHMFEAHIKLDTAAGGGNDGIAQFWIDGNLEIDERNVNYTAGDSVSRQGIDHMFFHSNQLDPNNGQLMYVDYDDIEIWRVTPPNTDATGNPWIGPLNGSPSPR